LIGSFHKTPIKDIKIDYSKRWQQLHVGALVSSYKSSPFFEYYYTSIENVITSNHIFLLDLNMHSIEVVLNTTGISTPFQFTSEFQPVKGTPEDYRNSFSPKKDPENIPSGSKKYKQVFEDRHGFKPGLSIIDLIFNTGPDAERYL
jgi:hypothetical protein